MMIELGLVSALFLAACSPSNGAQEAGPSPAAAEAEATPAQNVVVDTSAQSDVHPISGLKVIDLTVDTGEEVIPFRVELADSVEAQARGLMFRNSLGDFEGMYFPSEPHRPRSFWMRNTPLSLDIIFVGTDGRVQNIAADTVPYSLESVPSLGFTSGVLELRAGRSAELGIEPGDKVEYDLGE